MKQLYTLRASATVTTLLFSYTALTKLQAPEQFRQQLALQPLTGEAAGLLAWIIPLAGLLVCLLLIPVRTQLYGFYLATGLLLFFTTYIGLVLSGVWENIPCSCAGVFEGISWKSHFLLNLLFLCVAGAGLIICRKTNRRRGAGRAAPSGAVARLMGDR